MARRMISSGVSLGSIASIWCWWNQAVRIRPLRCIEPAIGFSAPASSLAKVDLPTPLTPRRPMRSSTSSRRFRFRSTGLSS